MILFLIYFQFTFILAEDQYLIRPTRSTPPLHPNRRQFTPKDGSRFKRSLDVLDIPTLIGEANNISTPKYAHSEEDIRFEDLIKDQKKTTASEYNDYYETSQATTAGKRNGKRKHSNKTATPKILIEIANNVLLKNITRVLNSDERVTFIPLKPVLHPMADISQSAFQKHVETFPNRTTNALKSDNLTFIPLKQSHHPNIVPNNTKPTSLEKRDKEGTSTAINKDRRTFIVLKDINEDDRRSAAVPKYNANLGVASLILDYPKNLSKIMNKEMKDDEIRFLDILSVYNVNTDNHKVHNSSEDSRRSMVISKKSLSAIRPVSNTKRFVNFGKLHSFVRK